DGDRVAKTVLKRVPDDIAYLENLTKRLRTVRRVQAERGLRETGPQRSVLVAPPPPPVPERQWARGQQTEACAATVVEPTRVQLALRGQWKHDGADPAQWLAVGDAFALIDRTTSVL